MVLDIPCSAHGAHTSVQYRDDALNIQKTTDSIMKEKQKTVANLLPCMDQLDGMRTHKLHCLTAWRSWLSSHWLVPACIMR